MIGLRLEPELEASLLRVARREGRTKSDIVRDAIRSFVERVEADEALLAELRTIVAQTSDGEMAVLDDANDDLLELIEDEERAATSRRAA